jgi:hypothetical protein
VLRDFLGGLGLDSFLNRPPAWRKVMEELPASAGQLPASYAGLRSSAPLGATLAGFQERVS